MGAAKNRRPKENVGVGLPCTACVKGRVRMSEELEW